MNKNLIFESLNGLRGFAVLLVLLSHASNKHVGYNEYLNFSGAGRYGVFLFFVLSAFLLTKQLLDIHIVRSSLKETLFHYFSRRFLRIYPLFFTSLIIYWILNTIGNPVYDINITDVIKSLLLIDGKGIFWTVAVEFQFYFILPIIALLIARINNVIALSIGLLIFITLLNQLFPPKYITNVLPFLPIFIIGSYGAYISNYIHEYNFTAKQLNIKIKTANFLAPISLLLFVILTPSFFNMIFDVTIERTYFHHEFITFGFISLILIISIIHGDSFIKKMMESRFLVFWGKISFRAYDYFSKYNVLRIKHLR